MYLLICSFGFHLPPAPQVTSRAAPLSADWHHVAVTADQKLRTVIFLLNASEIVRSLTFLSDNCVEFFLL